MSLWCWLWPYGFGYLLSDEGVFVTLVSWSYSLWDHGERSDFGQKCCRLLSLTYSHCRLLWTVMTPKTDGFLSNQFMDCSSSEEFAVVLVLTTRYSKLNTRKLRKFTFDIWHGMKVCGEGCMALLDLVCTAILWNSSVITPKNLFNPQPKCHLQKC